MLQISTTMYTPTDDLETITLNTLSGGERSKTLVTFMSQSILLSNIGVIESNLRSADLGVHFCLRTKAKDLGITWVVLVLGFSFDLYIINSNHCASLNFFLYLPPSLSLLNLSISILPLPKYQYIIAGIGLVCKWCSLKYTKAIYWSFFIDKIKIFWNFNPLSNHCSRILVIQNHFNL